MLETHVPTSTLGEYVSSHVLFKGRIVCGTVKGDMHLKDLLGSFVRVGCRILVPDFYLVLHGPLAAEKAL